MELEQLMPHVEALIFASERPLPQMEMIELLGNVMEEQMESDKVSICLEAVKEKYDTDYYPFELRETGGGYQFLTKKTYHQTVMQLNGDKYIKKLSSSAMETLAIITYKQPITKSEIEFIRGVSSDYSIQKLLEKELIVIAGRNEDAVGKPLIYATTKNFMDYLGVNSTLDLPQLSEVAGAEVIYPTNADEAIPEEHPNQKLIVDNNGELRVEATAETTDEAEETTENNNVAEEADEHNDTGSDNDTDTEDQPDEDQTTE
jgi:segregation and condensation protein B